MCAAALVGTAGIGGVPAGAIFAASQSRVATFPLASRLLSLLLLLLLLLPRLAWLEPVGRWLVLGAARLLLLVGARCGVLVPLCRQRRPPREGFTAGQIQGVLALCGCCRCSLSFVAVTTP